jgi:F-type H+-transporting ATPase subunit delta
MSRMSQDTTAPVIAGDAAILARRYAGALYDLAAEQKQLDAVAADLRLLKRLGHESKEFQHIIENLNLSRDQLVQMIRQVGEASGMSPLTSNFLGLIAKNRRLSHIGAVVDAFLADLAANRGEFTAEVRAARRLSPAQEEQLAQKLGAWAGGKVHLSVHEDPSLLGGFTVRMGSRLIDASVKTKLERLERQLRSDNITLEGAA